MIVDQRLYKSMIDSLLCLTAIHRDINFSVGVCDLFRDNPKTTHPTQVKRIIKYISVTYDYGILYSFDTNSLLVGYCDADWAKTKYIVARNSCTQPLWRK